MELTSVIMTDLRCKPICEYVIVAQLLWSCFCCKLGFGCKCLNISTEVVGHNKNIFKTCFSFIQLQKIKWHYFEWVCRLYRNYWGSNFSIWLLLLDKVSFLCDISVYVLIHSWPIKSSLHKVYYFFSTEVLHFLCNSV